MSSWRQTFAVIQGMKSLFPQQFNATEILKILSLIFWSMPFKRKRWQYSESGAPTAK